MQYWAVINNERKGPMTLDELTKLNVSADTLVWREGLQNWIQAKDLCELAPLFAPVTETIEVEETETTVQIEEIPQPPVINPEEKKSTPEPEQCNKQQSSCCGQENKQTSSWDYSNNTNKCGWNAYDQQGRPCPPTYLVLSIIVLACCCQILGIVSLVYASQVKSLYRMGNYEKSYNYSRKALWWSIAGLALGLVGGIIYTIIAVFNGFTDPVSVIDVATNYMP